MEVKPSKCDEKDVKRNYLEFDDNYIKNRIDLSTIVSDNEKLLSDLKADQLFSKKTQIKERDNSPGFIDDSTVPALS